MQATLESPLGLILLTEENGRLTGLEFIEEGNRISPQNPLLKQACRELTEYFSGARRNFTTPVSPKGTAFQKRVWRALQEIPYGETRTYAQIAAAVGNEKACRAVGGANGKNPVPIFIPCHRVIAANGKLGGFSCGLDKKKALLSLEGAQGQW